MAGVMIPVIVHLWNDRRGKVLRIGSVALLAGSSRRAAWSLRLTQLLLLFLRCLLVIALALLLAGPFYMRAPKIGKGWVLVDESAGGGPYQEYIDRRIRAGRELKVLDPGLRYWEGFRRLDSMAPGQLEFDVITPGLLGRFKGMRPVTGRWVGWTIYTPKDSLSEWVEAAWRVAPDSIMVLRGKSQATGTEFRRERVASRASTFEGVVVDTAAVEVVVDGNRQEQDYLRAALKALGEYTGRRVRVVSSGVDSGHVIRWRPEWSEAAWEGRLPVVLGRLLFEREGRADKDRRVIDEVQVRPVRVAGDGGVVRERVDLRPLVWGIVFALFFLERILVFRRGKA